MDHKCELCGTPVKVVGDTTKHYEPISSAQALIPFSQEEVIDFLNEVQAEDLPQVQYESRLSKQVLAKAICAKFATKAQPEVREIIEFLEEIMERVRDGKAVADMIEDRIKSLKETT